MTAPGPRLRRAWPYRRIAVVLSGGGALGAYEVGVLRVLEHTGIRPAAIAGVSVGAINGLLWLASGFRAEPLEKVWRTLKPSGIGLRWTTLALRALGMLMLAVALLEVVLSLLGSPELGVWRWLRGGGEAADDVTSVLLDVAAWIAVGLTGLLFALLSRKLEEWLAFAEERGWTPAWHRILGVLLVLGGVAHAITWSVGLPWPHRFSATLLVVLGLAWLAQRGRGGGAWLQRALIRMLPETGGRGAWGSDARRRLIRRALRSGGDLRRKVIDGETRLIVSACALDTGTMCYFVNWSDVTPAFERRVRSVLGEVQVMRRPRDAVEAVVASSALPIVYEPVRIRGRDFVDGAVFANQPLRLLVPDEADAVIVVLLSPPVAHPSDARPTQLVDLGARLLEMANWRDLQAELRALPDGWSRTPEGDAPARVVVVEPEAPLAGGVLGFDPDNAAHLIELGERDAWRALSAAGWLEGAPAAGEVPETGTKGEGA